jgi:hypothetical protein
MATDISNLDHLILLTQHSPDCHTGGPASLEVAVRAVLPEVAIMRPFSLNRARELDLSQQELKDFIYTNGPPLKFFVNVSR